MRECVHTLINMVLPGGSPTPKTEQAQTALTAVNELVRYKLSHHVVTSLLYFDKTILDLQHNLGVSMNTLLTTDSDAKLLHWQAGTLSKET